MPQGIGCGFIVFVFLVAGAFAGLIPLWLVLVIAGYAVVVGVYMGFTGKRGFGLGKYTYTGDRTVNVRAHKRRMPRRK